MGVVVRTALRIDDKAHPRLRVGFGFDSLRTGGTPVLRVQALKELPQPQELVAFGLLKTKPRPMISSLKSMVVLSR